MGVTGLLNGMVQKELDSARRVSGGMSSPIRRRKSGSSKLLRTPRAQVTIADNTAKSLMLRKSSGRKLHAPALEAALKQTDYL